MRVIAALLLAELGGNASPSVADIEKILGAVGSSLDADGKARAEQLIKDLEGKSVADVIAAGQERLASAPVGGVAAAPAAAGGAADAAPAEEVKEEAKEESEEDIGGGLFGDDDDDDGDFDF
mmetsp:Transcript_31625/g.88661  ORF Transcript_31625/g.88661 Transcript_31625/m.88661 type:complete len:122 (+) Transcript_31625:102-467(+)|eukprot:CAMPEP_0119123778 /NCGR_PEP_ID=MMETSP1310-20130426/3604_1 /TAXON_ID=464262 /ORGANISM="Genus nov. species nov., Strain RCC2339" /LENGTH=121 /DNA_ID=CAMNT_0007113641 /DNA_START=113 /DNA_END=478 /DNA_ORIENTATION=+